MSNLNYRDVYNNIYRRMTSIKWLQKNNISKDLIDSYLKDENFIAILKSMLD